jgi:hypothetical protein
MAGASAISETHSPEDSMPAILLWLLGVPIPIIILLALLF